MEGLKGRAAAVDNSVSRKNFLRLSKDSQPISSIKRAEKKTTTHESLSGSLDSWVIVPISIHRLKQETATAQKKKSNNRRRIGYVQKT
jgi:hypothetical protein